MDTDIKQATATAEELRLEISRYRSLCDTKDTLVNKLKDEKIQLQDQIEMYRSVLHVELMRNP